MMGWDGSSIITSVEPLGLNDGDGLSLFLSLTVTSERLLESENGRESVNGQTLSHEIKRFYNRNPFDSFPRRPRHNKDIDIHLGVNRVLF